VSGAGSDGANGRDGAPGVGWQGEEGEPGFFLPLKGDKGDTGATGAAGSSTGGVAGPPGIGADDPEAPFFIPPSSKADLEILTAGLPANIASGDQVPDLYFTASTAGVVSFAAVSGPLLAAGLTIDLKKNGSTQYASATKPAVPVGGGVSAERVPDAPFRVASGDKLTISCSGGTTGPAVVYIGFTPD
jgi:hypothetical protein